VSALGPDVIAAMARAMPGKPGVYRMLGADGAVLYVGKAKHLPKRVISYTRLAQLSNRIGRMVMQTAKMEYTITGTEAEALLLEAQLIKSLKPRFNVLMRDDKSFPYIVIRREHGAAQLMKHRGSKSVKGDYFGPFASSVAVNQTLEILQKAFLLRTCSDNVYDNRTRPCMLYDIKRCAGPCVGKVSEGDYAALVSETTAFLNGKSHDLRERLAAEMQTASDAMDFEQAARLRDRIKALAAISARQDVHLNAISEADIFAIATEGGTSAVMVVFVRAGQHWGDRAYYPRHERDQSPDDILDAFLAQFYAARPAPRHVLISHDVPSAGLLAEALKERSGTAVKIETPQRGPKRAAVDHAMRNAREALSRKLGEVEVMGRLLGDITRVFDLQTPPQRIEIYDNSHIQGAFAVGAMVVATPEGFDKSQYRKFNIRPEGLDTRDDFAMMRQVLTRRFTQLQKDIADGHTGNKPDLVLVDGGAGQLSSAQAILDELGITDVALVGISKGPDRNAGREWFHRTGKPAFQLPHDDPALYLLQRWRDEAHRFAIGTHRKRRSGEIVRNPLDTIPGVGAARKKALLAAFGSAKGVSGASVSDLMTVPGVSAQVAQTIFDHFHTA